MDKGHVYILQTLKNLEDQVLADNYTVGKELLHQTKIARELLDDLFKIKQQFEDLAEKRKNYNAGLAMTIIDRQRWAQDQMDVNAKEAPEAKAND